MRSFNKKIKTSKNLFSSYLKKLITVSIISVFVSFFSYLFNIYLAKVIGFELHGQYSYFLMIGSFVSILLLYGTNELSVKLISLDENYIGLIIIYRSFVAFILYLFSFFVSLFYFNHLLLCCALTVLTGFGFSGIFEHYSKFSFYSFLYALQRISFFIAVIVILENFGKNSLFYILYPLFIIDLVFYLFQIFYIRKKTNLFFDFNLLKTIMSKGHSVIIYTLSKLSTSLVVRHFIVLTSNFSTLSIFSLSWQFVTFTSLIYTQVTKLNRSNINKLYSARQCITKPLFSYKLSLFVISFISLLCVCFFGELLLTTVFQKNISEFKNMSYYIYCYIIISSVDSYTNTLIVVLNLVKFAKSIFLISSIIFVLFVFISYSLLQNLHVVMIANLIIYSFSLFLINLRIKKSVLHYTNNL